jgi:hypothetical protein
MEVMDDESMQHPPIPKEQCQIDNAEGEYENFEAQVVESARVHKQIEVS